MTAPVRVIGCIIIIKKPKAIKKIPKKFKPFFNIKLIIKKDIKKVSI